MSELQQLVPAELLMLALGGLLLLFGRRLYFLLLGVVGFSFGWSVATQLDFDASGELRLGIALLGAILCAVLALFVHKVVLGIAGFVIGAVATLWLLDAYAFDLQLGGSPELVRWALVIVGGIAFSLLLQAVFNGVLILLSSVVGAHLVTSFFVLPREAGLILMLGLVAFGLFFQSRGDSRRRRNRRERERRQRRRERERYTDD